MADKPDNEEAGSTGAMAPCHDLYAARLERTRQVMRQSDTPVLLILDSVNVLYATGAANMTIFSTRTPARYLLLFAEGPAILFDYFGCEHLARDLPTIDQVRPARGLCHVSSGGAPAESCRAFAEDIAATVREQLGQERRLAVDRFPFLAIDALRDSGFRLSDADAVLSAARRIKLPVELPYLGEAMRRVERAVGAMADEIRPGAREAEIWSAFHAPFVAEGGQYVSTRLMQSGQRTFPYFQECGDRRVEGGELICLDTDALGYQGYAVDFSRTFICGDRKPTPAQHDLYARAKEQLDWNCALIRPGAALEEIADKAWPIPEAHQESRYYCIGHGLGMSGEHPNIPHKTPGARYPMTGLVEPGMVLCIESYIGSSRAGQGVKLEDQLLVTESGAEPMSRYPFDDRLLGRSL